MFEYFVYFVTPYLDLFFVCCLFGGPLRMRLGCWRLFGKYLCIFCCFHDIFILFYDYASLFSYNVLYIWWKL